MNINTYISNDIAPIRPDDSIEHAQLLFKQLTYTHLPVVSDDQLMGNLFENDTQGFQASKKVSDYQYSLEAFHVTDTTNWLDVLEALAQNQANIVPVLDEKGQYQGYYELTDILSFFNDTPFLNEPGGILVIEKGIRDYSFSEISQIVESNNGKVLGAFISESREDIIQITLKIANSGLNDIMQTFRRYSYNIISGNEDDIYLNDLKQRSDYLKKYLNI